MPNVDVEGYELDVFLGAEKVIARHHPLIFCEIERRHNPDYARTFALLRSHGYLSFVFNGGGPRLFDGDTIDKLQSDVALAARLSGTYDSRHNAYINNFVFQHPASRIKVAQ